jgi:hypothetical protein
MEPAAKLTLVPLELVSVMEVMFMEKATIQSAGASPKLIWTLVAPACVGLGEFDAPFPPQPKNASNPNNNAERVVIFHAGHAKESERDFISYSFKKRFNEKRFAYLKRLSAPKDVSEVTQKH